MAYVPKTQKNDASVIKFIDSIEEPKQKEEALELLDLYAKISGYTATMWGGSIIGFGTYHYKYASGQEGDWMRGGFSPRKGKHSLYLMGGFDPHLNLLQSLGKYKTGKSCLYIRKLSDVDRGVLEQLILASFEHMKKLYPED